MLAYKAIRLGVEVQDTNEKFSSVTCSVCSSRSGPSGLSGLGVRQWVCRACGSSHDRDVNAAINILAAGLGHQTLMKGISRLQAREDVNFGAGPERVEVQFSHDNSPCWIGLRAIRIKNGRRTADIMTSLDKSQIERLIENLKVLSERIDY